MPVRAGIVLIEPAGIVREVSQFRWQSNSFLDSYYVEVRDDDGVIYFATMRTTSFVVPADLQERLVPGRYRWRVMGRDVSRAALVATLPETFVVTGVQ
jgi:hypothetical protein